MPKVSFTEDQIRNALVDHGSVKDASKSLNITRQGFMYWANKYGVKCTNPNHMQELRHATDAKVEAAYFDGATYDDIVKSTGIIYDTVIKSCKRQGLKTKNKADDKKAKRDKKKVELALEAYSLGMNMGQAARHIGIRACMFKQFRIEHGLDHLEWRHGNRCRKLARSNNNG